MAAKKFSCGKCNVKFPTKTKLTEHNKTHTAKNKKPAPKKVAAEAKAKETSSPKQAKQAKITEEPPQKEAMERSLRPKPPPSPSRCNKCDKEFATLRGLKKHKASCKATKATVKQEKAAAEREVAEVDGENSADDQAENGNTLRAQLRGKFTTRVQSLLKASQAKANNSLSSSSSSSSSSSPDSSPEKDEGGDGKAVFKCNKCPAVFKLKSSVDRHKKVLHLEGPSHVCDMCGARCADKGTLARHQYTHTGLKPFQCDTCNRQFSRKYHLDRHLVETKCGGKDESTTYPCMVCLKEFSRKSNLREHLKTHAGETSAKTFTCEFCQKVFHSYSLMQIHVRKHTGEKPFKCDHCDKTFPSMGAVKKHRRIHTGERPYECPDCNATFALKGTLNRHVRIHTGVKPHKCPYCGKQFIQSGGLKAHLFHHTGENGFKCGFCNKSFNRKARLQMHVKYIHEKTKPYECDICQKAFVRKEDLNRHTALHSGLKPFVCPTCNKCFAIKPSLKLHLLTHTREEPKACHECGRAFIRQDCLLRHMRKRHRDMLEKIIQDAEKFRLRTTETATDRVLTETQLSESIRELLSLLVDEPTLRGFGWPDKPVDQLLEAVIRRCGHTPVNPEDYTFMDRLRENSKLLFTVVIDDNAVRTLLNNQTVDEVILHVLRLAKA